VKKNLTDVYNQLHKQMSSETLPEFYRYQPNAIAAPAEARRLWVSPRSGNEFAPGSKIEFQLTCGQPGMHLDPTQTAFVFSLQNKHATQTLTLDGGAHALIEQIDVSFGSQVISTLRAANGLYQLLSDFQCDGDSLRAGGHIRGVAPYDTTSTLSESTVEAAMNSRKGALVGSTSTSTFALPVLCCIGTLALKAIPLSALMDNITVEIRLASVNQYGVYSGTPAAADFVVKDCKLFHSLIKLDGRVEAALYASLGNVISVPTLDYRNYSTSIGASTGSISWTIPHKSASATAIFITLRPAADLDSSTANTLTARTKATMTSYRFMVGSEVVPQSAVICAGDAVEARLELNRAFGVMSETSSRSCINGAAYGTDGFCIGLNLSAFPRSDALSDGVSTRNRHLVFEATLTSSNPAVRVDAWVCSETLLVAENGLLMIDI